MISEIVKCKNERTGCTQVDKEVLDGETLGCHPCINTSSLKLKTKEVMEKFLPAVHHEAVIVELPRYEEQE